MENNISDIIESQNEIIKSQSDMICCLANLLRQYISVEEFEEIERKRKRIYESIQRND